MTASRGVPPPAEFAKQKSRPVKGGLEKPKRN
jgi:hypothetical protein